MQVFKFGGSSIHDANGIKNLYEIVNKHKGCKLVVASALARTTNSLEDIVSCYFKNDNGWREKLKTLKQLHFAIVSELFSEKNSQLDQILESSFSTLASNLKKKPKFDFDKEYDQIVSLGEVWSTLIVEAYLAFKKMKTKWVDAREVLITDDTYGDANVDWKVSAERIKKEIKPEKDILYIVQGFIGGTTDTTTTTLGREGSDYTAAILGSILNAESVTLWKDVPGVLNADPKSFKDPERLSEISYLEAVELAFFGAKVIHPKTIKPLHNKRIPLFVKSFTEPDSIGTIIHSLDHVVKMIPVYVRKEDQILISVRPYDLSFMIEQSFGHIFSVFNRNKVKINLVQTSAISLSICADNNQKRMDRLLEELRKEFRITFNNEVQLITIRHYTREAIDLMTEKKQVLIEQKSRQTVHFVLKDV